MAKPRKTTLSLRELGRRERAAERRRRREERRLAKREMAMLRENRPTKDHDGAARQRQLAESRLKGKIASNAAIAEAHERPAGGPPPVATVERQPQPIRPAIRQR